MLRALAVVLVAPALLMLTQEPAVIQKSTVMISTVKRGDVIQMVRGQGEITAQRLAEIDIPERSVKDLKAGQKAILETSRAVIHAKVTRVSDTVADGNRQVELQLDSNPPAGIGPGEAFDGAIILSTLTDVLIVGGPTDRLGELEGQSGTIFKLEADGASAKRVQVTFGLTGRSTGETKFEKVIELRSGLQVGDTVVLSDLPASKGHDRIRLQ
jgi:HlyD family secretion protein